MYITGSGIHELSAPEAAERKAFFEGITQQLAQPPRANLNKKRKATAPPQVSPKSEHCFKRFFFFKSLVKILSCANCDCHSVRFLLCCNACRRVPSLQLPSCASCECHSVRFLLCCTCLQVSIKSEACPVETVIAVLSGCGCAAEPLWLCCTALVAVLVVNQLGSRQAVFVYDQQAKKVLSAC